jgi:hypothetical protein
LQKLSAYGFSDGLLRWVESYLQGRKFYTVVNGFQSETEYASSGVPQGSHLGPVLFGIFINDIPEYLCYSKPYMYADDLKLSREIRSLKDCLLLQTDIDNVCKWCKVNKMALNISKCFYVKFGRKHDLISQVYTVDGAVIAERDIVNDLGVLFDRKLTFIPHMDNITRRASKMLGFVLRNIKTMRSSKTKILVYNNLVRSTL